MDKKTSEYLRNLGRQAESELFRVKKQDGKIVMDERSTKRMDEFYRQKIALAIKKGIIPKAKEDGWMKKFAKR